MRWENYIVDGSFIVGWSKAVGVECGIPGTACATEEWLQCHWMREWQFVVVLAVGGKQSCFVKSFLGNRVAEQIDPPGRRGTVWAGHYGAVSWALGGELMVPGL